MRLRNCPNRCLALAGPIPRCSAHMHTPSRCCPPAGLLTFAEAEVSRLLKSKDATAADLCFSLQVGAGARG